MRVERVMGDEFKGLARAALTIMRCYLAKCMLFPPCFELGVGSTGMEGDISMH